MVKKRRPVKKPKKPKPPKPRPGGPPRPDTPKIPKKRPKPLKKRPRKPRADELTWYLTQNPRMANAIKWGGLPSMSLAWQRYPTWSAAQKADLAATYARLRGRRFPRLGPGGSKPVPEPPLSATPVPAAFDTSNVGLGTIYDHAVAWPYFLAYVAQSLLVEIYQLVPWSLGDLTDPQLDEILSTIGLFEYDGPPSNQYRLWYAATPGDPLNVSQFLFTNALIGANRRATIGRLLQWCARMRHFIGYYNPATALDHWQYNGWPPVERVIGRTTHPQYGIGHWTAGCGGTTSFLKIVLRTINIPVVATGAGGHTLTYFLSEGAYLSHGDDPYDRRLIASPPIPIDELLIDQATFDAWFGPGVPAATRTANVSRQCAELSLRYLSNRLLTHRCTDIANGVTSESASAVYTQYLATYYSVAELQALNLWSRLDTKIAALGGCANIPP